MTDLKAMFEAVRDQYDGTHRAPDRTLERALAASREKTRSRKVVRWLVLPAAAVLTVSTAYAGATRQLGGVVDRVRDVIHLGPEREAPASSEGASTRANAAKAEAEAAAKAEINATVKSGASAPVAIVAPPPAPAATTTVAPSAASTADPQAALYEEAHRLHFAERDPARALAAWDRYLAVAPSGRFAPEARYNRALALVRLGRTAEARAALRPFLDGSYRRDEARKLYDALGGDESP